MRNSILLSAICATTAVTAVQQFTHNLWHKNSLDKRQSLYCGEGNTCADACGSGYAQCGDADEFNCYNYADGETCCDYDPAYSCESGAYCAVVGGDPTCCPGGYSPDECGAEQILSILPPSASAAAPVSSYSSYAYGSYSSGGYYSSSGIVYAPGDTCREAFGVGWQTW